MDKVALAFDIASEHGEYDPKDVDIQSFNNFANFKVFRTKDFKEL